MKPLHAERKERLTFTFSRTWLMVRTHLGTEIGVGERERLGEVTSFRLAVIRFTWKAGTAKCTTCCRLGQQYVIHFSQARATSLLSLLLYHSARSRTIFIPFPTPAPVALSFSFSPASSPFSTANVVSLNRFSILHFPYYYREDSWYRIAKNKSC